MTSPTISSLAPTVTASAFAASPAPSTYKAMGSGWSSPMGLGASHEVRYRAVYEQIGNDAPRSLRIYVQGRKNGTAAWANWDNNGAGYKLTYNRDKRLWEYPGKFTATIDTRGGSVGLNHKYAYGYENGTCLQCKRLDYCPA